MLIHDKKNVWIHILSFNLNKNCKMPINHKVIRKDKISAKINKIDV
jgi:hypothetical protein